MKNTIMICLFFVSGCVNERNTVKIVNEDLLKEVINFANELQSDPKIRNSYDVTVNIREESKGIYRVWIINSQPFNGCQNLVGELYINEYRVFIVMNEDYSQFVEKIGNYECTIKPLDSELANYFETFYEYDGKTMKVLGMPSSYP